MPMTTQPLLDDGQMTDYAGQLEILTDDDFVNEAAKQIYEAGHHPRMSVADQKAGICYVEATSRREKPWLYARAYNRAAADAGIGIDETDRARARPPIAA